MPMRKTASRLEWGGEATVSAIGANLERDQRTVLRLPADCHHRLTERLYPQVRAKRNIDRCGDAQLLETIATIDGLHALARLVEPMRAHGARLRVRSPAPHLLFNVPKPRKENDMATEKIRARLAWRGRESLPAIVEALSQRERLLLRLPSGFHHALTVQLDDTQSMQLALDVALDDTAFTLLARITGLHPLAELRPELQRYGMKARLRTPPPQILFVPEEPEAQQAHRCEPALAAAL